MMPPAPTADPACPEAIAVLGCRLSWDASGRLTGAAARRAATAASVVHQLVASGVRPRVIACGGRPWAGVVEADALADELIRLGVVRENIWRERHSWSTRENARFALPVLRAWRVERVIVVTCDWHLPRAVSLFSVQGLEVSGKGAVSDGARWRTRLWRWGRERLASRMNRL